MHTEVAGKREALRALCRRHGVARLEVFGSAARGTDFEPRRSDIDFLVVFGPDARDELGAYMDFKEALEELLEHSVDLVEREALESSRNFIRRRAILEEAEPVHG